MKIHIITFLLKEICRVGVNNAVSLGMGGAAESQKRIAQMREIRHGRNWRNK